MDATFVKIITEGGAIALLIVVLFGVGKGLSLVFTFFTNRLNSWGTFAENIANKALKALEETQKIAVEVAQALQTQTDVLSNLCERVMALETSNQKQMAEHAAMSAKLDNNQSLLIGLKGTLGKERTKRDGT